MFVIGGCIGWLLVVLVVHSQQLPKVPARGVSL